MKSEIPATHHSVFNFTGKLSEALYEQKESCT
jgi:hypothetical protein